VEQSAAESLIEQLRVAVEHRTTIGVALGIVMERHQVTQEQAWLWLVAESQRRQRKLYDLAVQLGATGELGAGLGPGPR
jgi:AmiR/NasT family two-component response regulator